MIRTTSNLLVTAYLALCAATAAFAQDEAAAAANPVVTVLDAGTEPRRELRYRFEDGSSEMATIEMTIRLNVSLGGSQQQAVAFPTVRMEVDLGPMTVADDGSARYDFAISSAELVNGTDTNANLAAALRGSLGQLPSVSGWAQIDPRGTTLAGDINLAGGVDPQLTQVFDSAEQSLQQMLALLPLEPVGLGARWQVDQDAESAGFSVTQTVVYTLTSIDGNEVMLDISLTQSGSDQAVDFAGLPAGIEANLDSLESTGTGAMRINLNRFVPQSESAVAMIVSLGLVLQGQAQQIGLDMRTEMSIAPAN